MDNFHVLTDSFRENKKNELKMEKNYHLTQK